jgi:hypothetical protein
VRFTQPGSGLSSRPHAGIRYLSRLNTDWECWAVFDHVTIEELTRRPILRSDESLARIARLYQLVVF